MIEKLLPLMGKSIESEEIKNLFAEWRLKYPTKTTCTPNHSTVKGKFEKEGVLLYFTIGEFSRYLKPIPARVKNSYIGIFSMIEFTKKCTLDLPFGVKRTMQPEELTAIFGEPKVTNFLGKTTIWRKNYTDRHEFVVNDSVFPDGTALRSITLTFNFETDLKDEDYVKVGA
jgi:hypothetical protein